MPYVGLEVLLIWSFCWKPVALKRSCRTSFKQKGLLCNALTLNIEFLVHYSSSMLQASPIACPITNFVTLCWCLLICQRWFYILWDLLRPCRPLWIPVCTVITSETLFVSYPLSAHDIAFELRGHHLKALQLYFLQ